MSFILEMGGGGGAGLIEDLQYNNIRERPGEKTFNILGATNIFPILALVKAKFKLCIRSPYNTKH